MYKFYKDGVGHLKRFELDEDSDVKIKVKIVCPICKKEKELFIPLNSIKTSKTLTTVSIPPDFCCEHHFQVYLDKNFHIRGYQKVDILLDDIQLINGLDYDLSKKSLLDEKEIKLIKNLFPTIVYVYIFKAILLGKNVIVISEELDKVDIEILETFLKTIMQNLFEYNVKVINDKSFELNRLMDDTILIQDLKVKGIKNFNKNTKVINSIIAEFYEKKEKTLPRLNKRIRLIHKEVNFIIKKFSQIEESTNKMEIKDALEKIFLKNYNKDYFDFLLEIINNYYKIKLNIYSDIMGAI